MKWTGVYFLGYVILIGGLVAALAKAGVLSTVGPAWTAIGIVIALGFGVMIAVSRSGKKESIEIER